MGNPASKVITYHYICDYCGGETIEFEEPITQYNLNKKEDVVIAVEIKDPPTSTYARCCARCLKELYDIVLKEKPWEKKTNAKETKTKKTVPKKRGTTPAKT